MRAGAWRGGGLSSDRLVLIGIGVHAACTSITVLIIVKADPWNTVLALTWLSGSTYGRVPAQLIPVALALPAALPLLAWLHRDLDLLSLDEDTPRILVSLADTLGRTVIAPAQVPAGLVTALLGTPYFVYLLWRAHADSP